MSTKSTSKLFQDTEELKEQDINLPEEEEKVESEEVEEKEVEEAVTENVPAEVVENDIQDIDLSVIKRQKFRINGDNSKIIELNTSDMGIATRLKEAYPRLNSLVDSISERFNDVPDDEATEKQLKAIGEAIEDIDKKMRDEIDYIFNSPVSVVFDEGSMWDPIDGMFRYEHIIDKLAKLYENNLDKEFANIKRRVETTAGKYVKLQDHKKKAKK